MGGQGSPRTGGRASFLAPGDGKAFHCSFYFAVRDGVRLAVRLLMPAHPNLGQRWPLILCFYRYNLPASNPRILLRWAHHLRIADMAMMANQTRPDPMEASPWFKRLIGYGFAIGIVDVRGTGASFGVWPGPFSLLEARDAHDVIEGLAVQSWCTGQIGLAGRSYMGANQFVVALLKPSALVGLFAEMAPYDTYHLVHQNGIFREDFAQSWAEDVRFRDIDAEALPLDEDLNGATLALARAEHRSNVDVLALFQAARLRDDRCRISGVAPYEALNPAAHIARAGGIDLPVHIVGGWHDINSGDALLYQQACRGRVRSLIGPWAHGGSYGTDLAAECANWFHCLMRQFPEERREDRSVTTIYCQMGGKRAEWFEAVRPDFRPSRSVRLHLAPGTTRKGGRLSEAEPFPSLIGPHAADPDASSGLGTRWSNGYGGPFGYGDMTGLAARGLCLVSPEFAEPMELVGTPVLDVMAAETTAPTLFFFLLDEHPDGFAQYVTEGALALTHRRLCPELYPTGGLPFHRGCSADLLPSGVVSDRLRVALQPVAWRFEPGHRLQLVVTAADRDNAECNIRRDHVFAFQAGPRLSWLDLPVDTGPGGHFRPESADPR